ncbi:LacI family DNA-binding transcriptional regulator [Diaminobutyricibacter sp. McL0618]|uniref:LacI family DNA-binding transcriptional regulator n=1 Tax=Leifsonia sp. McL0618 TaxID=3415677 RepID=UPI003CF49C6A
MSLEVGLKEVAFRAGVSPSTASNALSGARPVSEQTRKRVFAIAEELNYRPNLVARGLRRQETRTIALLVADIANPYYPAVARAIQDRIGAHGYVSFIGNTDGDPKAEVRVLEEMRARSVDGVIMSTMALSPERIRNVVGPTMPLVLITGEWVETPNPHVVRKLRADEVGTDDAMGIKEAVDHLRGRGVTDIGFISGPAGSVPGDGRLERFRDAMAEAGLSVNEAWIEQSAGYVLETGYDAADRLLSRPSRPKAILCANDLIAIGVLEAARDNKLDVPTELSVIGFDDIPTAKHVSPRLTTIINPARLVGYACADALMRRMEHPDAPFEHTALATHLVARGSA